MPTPMTRVQTMEKAASSMSVLQAGGDGPTGCMQCKSDQAEDQHRHEIEGGEMSLLPDKRHGGLNNGRDQ